MTSDYFNSTELTEKRPCRKELLCLLMSVSKSHSLGNASALDVCYVQIWIYAFIRNWGAIQSVYLAIQLLSRKHVTARMLSVSLFSKKHDLHMRSTRKEEKTLFPRVTGDTPGKYEKYATCQEIGQSCGRRLVETLGLDPFLSDILADNAT